MKILLNILKWEMMLISLLKKILQILLFKTIKIIRCKNNEIGVLWLRIFELFQQEVFDNALLYPQSIFKCFKDVSHRWIQSWSPSLTRFYVHKQITNKFANFKKWDVKKKNKFSYSFTYIYILFNILI